jgi:uncharacterized protein with HEPN domain
MRSDLERLHDILEAIGRIERYAAEGRERFDRDELVQTWIVHHIQLIGEAARGLSEHVRRRSPAIPWARIIGMRHILVHDYFGLDLEEVWGTVVRDLPGLKRDLEAIVLELGSRPEMPLTGDCPR